MAKIRISQPLWKRTNKDFTWVQSPISADAPQDIEIHKREFELPFKNTISLWTRHSFQGWQLSPLSDDIPQETIQLSEWRVPQEGRTPRHVLVYAGHQYFAIPENNEVALGVQYDVPQSKETNWAGHNFDGWQQSPLAASNELALGYSNEVVGSRLSLTKEHTYVGWQQTPLPDDIPQETISYRFELPTLSAKVLFKKNDFGGWTQQPLSADAPISGPESITVKALELPILGREKHFYDGWQQQPLPDSNEIALGAATDLAPWIQDRNRYDGYQQAPLADNVVVVEEPISSPFFDLPLSEVPFFEGFLGWVSAPLSEDSAVVSTIPRDRIPAIMSARRRKHC